MSISINTSSKKNKSLLDQMPGLINETAGIEEESGYEGQEVLGAAPYKGGDGGGGGERGRGVVVVVSCQLSQGTEVTYRTVLVDRVLYVEVGEGVFSKEAFVTLLEYAETALRCLHVVVRFSKHPSHRAQLVKMFNFLGFTVLPPSSPLVPPTDAINLYMIYTVDQ